MKPNEVNFDNASQVFDLLYGKYYKKKAEQPIDPHFTLNQKVRIVLPRNIFAKGIIVFYDLEFLHKFFQVTNKRSAKKSIL